MIDDPVSSLNRQRGLRLRSHRNAETAVCTSFRSLAIRFYDGMTKANTHSHDNPESATVPVPEPAEFEADVAAIDKLIADLKKEQADVEAKRPSMKLVR